MGLRTTSITSDVTLTLSSMIGNSGLKKKQKKQTNKLVSFFFFFITFSSYEKKFQNNSGVPYGMSLKFEIGRKSM